MPSRRRSSGPGAASIASRAGPRVKSWLYRITTNVCLDMLSGRERRATPMDLGPAREPVESNLNVPTEVTWIQPIPDPADVAVDHETIRLAFVAALQHLPARQRAVLILCEVLRWQATEVAELLDTSVASVNSALQRARATLASRDVTSAVASAELDEADRALLARYVEAFERYDIDALTSLIQEDASQSMPPFDMWLAGRDDILTWWFGPGIGCKGSRVVPTTQANGSPAFGQYKPSARRRVRALGAPGARAFRGADRRVHVLPRHRDALPVVRSAAAARRVGHPSARRTRSARRARPRCCAGRHPGRAVARRDAGVRGRRPCRRPGPRAH